MADIVDFVLCAVTLYLPYFANIKFKNTTMNLGFDWGDLLFHNDQKREKLEGLLNTIKATMIQNFDACNQLSQVLNARIHTNFPPIRVNMSATIKENGDVLVHQMTKIQETLKNLDAKLKQHCDSIDPSIYRKLEDPDLSFEKVLNVIKPIEASIVGVIGSLAAIAFAVWLKSALAFAITGTIELWVAIGAGLFGSIVIGMTVALIIGPLFGVITGAVESHKLDEALEKTQAAHDKFVPQSKEYTRRIYEMVARIENVKA